MPYNPTANSISERINQSVGYIFRIEKENYNLEEILNKINNNINCTLNRTIKTTPHEVIYGYNPNDPLTRPSRIKLQEIRRNIEEAGSKGLKERNKKETLIFHIVLAIQF